jgi:hypothetical protein
MIFRRIIKSDITQRTHGLSNTLAGMWPGGTESRQINFCELPHFYMRIITYDYEFISKNT